ncbi:hypothetical protein BJX64DRAFT_299013 [Aspergillus heterothallicus]
MPSRDFQRDLTQACLPGTFSRLTDVRAGSESGTFLFTYATPSGAHTIDVEATVIDTSDYPRGHNYFAFATSPNAPDVVPIVLESLQGDGAFRGLTIQRFLRAISESLDEATLAEDSQWHSPLDDTDGSEAFDDMEWEDSTFRAFLSPESTIDVRDRIRYDLRKVKEAGFRVGLLGSLGGSVILSASYRISKLGISHEAMEAWQVRPSDYLVLLIRYPSGYRPLTDVIRNSHTNGPNLIQLYAGLCESYKPSYQSALHTFLSGEGAGSTTDQNNPIFSEGMEPVLKSLFIGKSLQTLLNDRFVNIIRYRLDHEFSWAGAELYLNDGQGRLTTTQVTQDPEYLKPDRWRTPPPAVVLNDHLAETKIPSNMSLLLIAMQFTLRRFVKCTEFCLNCYCKINTNFEALKPYVCTKWLCLFQYINLGMGPSLEWEISSQPYVVDLLISFAYARASARKLEDFPNGLNLQIPRSGVPTGDPPGDGGYSAKFAWNDNMPCIHVEGAPSIKEGDWIVITITHAQPNPLKMHARVVDTSGWPSIAITWSSVLKNDKRMTMEDVATVARKVEKVTFTLYDSDFDKISQIEKCMALTALLDTLPAVSSMKLFVDTGHGGHLRRLAEWKEEIQPAALQVLQWIVGSNRSVLMYDDNPQQQVSGMDGYLQFRFAQGAPDKEQLFVSAVETTTARLNLQYPTLFAWHGSGLQNWHSIVREGFHYKYIAHGRSFGNGIYMAPAFNTSLTYTGGLSNAHYSHASSAWQGSALKCQYAISLNEVVNAPAEFVCQNPYVVQHVDWVQPRYLFIKCDPDMQSNLRLSKKEPLRRIYAQDPQRLVHGPGNLSVQIPISAINSHRAVNQANPQPQTKLHRKIRSPKGKQKAVGSSHAEPIMVYDTDGEDTGSVATLSEDQLLLLSDNEEAAIPDEGKWPDARLEFEPSSLDLSTIMLLGEPRYATSRSTRSLQRELNAARKAQNKRPLHEIGWYIHSDIIQNMYQWIVELHSFEKRLPLAQDLKKAGHSSVVMEIRFPSDYPLSPPFLRVIRPRFLRYSEGGGGHVTAGGAMCMELLTNTGWLPTSSIDSILLQVWMAITNEEPRPARLDPRRAGQDYMVGEAIAEYKRVCHTHGWAIPKDIDQVNWGP